MIEILNENLKKLDILRKYTFAQYEDKFREIGSFEIHARIVDENLYLLDKEKEFYVLFDGEVFGKIENIKKESDSEYEKIITIKGRLGTLLFTKRVIAGTIKYKGNTAHFIRDIIYNEIVKDAQSKRYINIDLQYDNEEYLNSFCSQIEKQVTGGYVWDEIQKVMEQDKLGIYFVPIVETEHIEEGEIEPTNISKWKLTISAGKDRTKNNKQGNVPVVFSQSLSNIARTDYELDTSKYCNVAYVAGEGEEENRKWYEVYTKEEVARRAVDKKGWKRNELWIDARDIQSSDGEGDSITEEEYEQLINQRASEKFTENAKQESYTSTITEANKQYIYGKDFYKGDLVTVIDDELGISIDVQITNVTKSIEGVREIVDIGFTYGKINRDPVKQIETIESIVEKNGNDIKYIENVLNLSKDYVLEQGKCLNDNWYYRKWSSGILEAWQINKRAISYNFQYEYGYSYYASSVDWFFEIIGTKIAYVYNIFMSANQNGGGGLTTVVINFWNVKEGKLYWNFNCMSPKKETKNVVMNCYIFARWK